MANKIHQATFGAKDGSHQLLESSLPATTPVLEELRFLVDRPAGHIDPSVSWSPYWGCQPVREWWTVWRGEEDPTAPRKNMVRASVALIPLAECGNVSDLSSVLSAVGHCSESSGGAEFAGTVVERLAVTNSPIAIPNLSIAPGLLSALWPRLWVGARRELSLRTVFAAESLNISTPPRIALFPAALLTRWRGIRVTSEPDQCSSPAGRWFAGEASPQLRRLLHENAEHLPGDYSVLIRLNRLVEKLDALHSGQGSLADALLIVRTQEAFPGGLSLPPEDAAVVGEALLKLVESAAGEVRTASLTRMDQVPNREAVKGAVTRWVKARIAEANDQDALWILQHHLSESHSAWWRDGVAAGLASAVGTTRILAIAMWRWLELQPQALRWIESYLDANERSEVWLAADAPTLPGGTLLDEVRRLCSTKDWPTLLATVLRGRRPLADVVGVIRSATATPELGLEALVAERSAPEVVVAAATTAWPPLLDRAADATRTQPHLFASVGDKPAVFELLRRHLVLGGRFPEELITVDFLTRVFDGLLGGDDNASAIAKRLPTRAGGVALVHNGASTVLARSNDDVKAGAAETWWTRFTTEEHSAPPPEAIRPLVVDSVRERTKGASIVLVIRLLEILPSIDESSCIEWIRHTEFFWEDGDHLRLAQLLESRQWKSAATAFRRSWKQELKLVAWYAKSLLSWSDRFWLPPSGAGSSSSGATPATHNHASNAMQITFLAANPLSSKRLALDEEARSIEKKVRDAKHRDLVTFRTRWAVRPEDLQQVLLEDEPVVVHFSGHGGGAIGIVLHSQDQDAENLVAEDALVDLFRVLKDDIRVVVLNACYSEVQALAIVKEIDFVVGMSDSVADDAARVFAAAFYRGLAFGRSVQTAFDLGINELRLVGLDDEDDIPQLLVRSGMDASATKLVGAV